MSFCTVASVVASVVASMVASVVASVVAFVVASVAASVVASVELAVVLSSVRLESSDGFATHPETKACIIKTISRVIMYLLYFNIHCSPLSTTTIVLHILLYGFFEVCHWHKCQ